MKRRMGFGVPAWAVVMGLMTGSAWGATALPPEAPPEVAPEVAPEAVDAPEASDMAPPAEAAVSASPETEMAAARGKADEVLAALREDYQRLQLEYQLATQRQQNELLRLQLEKQKLEAEAALRAAKQVEGTAAVKSELEELQRQSQLSQARLQGELAEAKARLEKLGVEKQLREAALADELAGMKAEAQRLAAQRELEQARRQAELAELQARQQKLVAEQQLKQLELRSAALEAEARSQLRTMELAAAQARVQTRGFEHQWEDEINEQITYRDEPFVEGVLYISDRRVPLNGPIVTGTADYICDRIDYFNNASKTQPIFLVIDNCPGGSVMQGYRIVKAIEASEAPVHVVVKSLAASMAAVITTLADHSYAYPNAVILHHQMSAGASGNMTDMEQQIATMREWERRLAEPVAAKMGLSVEAFKKKMYEAKASGDWDEFATEAVELGWVNTVVHDIREEGLRVRPTGEAPKPWWLAFLSQDEAGRKYVKLPPLEPMDAYFMYNPGRFYRVDGM